MLIARGDARRLARARLGVRDVCRLLQADPQPLRHVSRRASDPAPHPHITCVSTCACTTYNMTCIYMTCDMHMRQARGESELWYRQLPEPPPEPRRLRAAAGASARRAPSVKPPRRRPRRPRRCAPRTGAPRVAARAASSAAASLAR
eukprot:6172866-Prymnesium_polylepis.1